MSARDVLSAAARALHDHVDGDAAESDAGRTRARVLLAARATRKRRARAAAVLIPIAAVLALSTAWAGARVDLPRAWRSLRTVLAGDDARAHAPVSAQRTPAPAGLRAPAADPTASPLVETSPVPEVVATVDVDDLPRVRSSPETSDRAASARAETTPVASASAPPPHDAPSDAEDDLYAAAHRAHFALHDPEAALDAWDAYLRAFPAGRLAIEARYDRALTLVRLQRDDDARAALAPFAAGTYGAYRRAEARRLLDVMDGARRR